jgi:hypothetical protein
MAVTALLAAGCGDGDDGGAGGAGDAGSTTPGATPAPPTTSAAKADASGVPDACSLISSDRLGQLLGSNQGAGSGQGPAPERSICIYAAGGTITAVEVASHYQASRDIIEDQGRKTTDVSGVGKAAFFDEAGQLVATGERVFVAVTASGVDRSKLAEVLREMLRNAGENA